MWTNGQLMDNPMPISSGHSMRNFTIPRNPHQHTRTSKHIHIQVHIRIPFFTPTALTQYLTISDSENSLTGQKNFIDTTVQIKALVLVRTQSKA